MLEKKLEKLTADFPPERLRARIVSTGGRRDGAQAQYVTIVPYIGQTDIERRLDEVDPEGWRMTILRLDPLPNADDSGGVGGTQQFLAVVELSVCGVVRHGIGTDRDPRAAVTFAFKNACARFGIARHLDEIRAHIAFPDEQTARKFGWYVLNLMTTWDDALNYAKRVAKSVTVQLRPGVKAPAASPGKEATPPKEEPKQATSLPTSPQNKPPSTLPPDFTEFPVGAEADEEVPF